MGDEGEAMIRAGILGIGLVVLAGAALAQVPTGDAVAPMLFPDTGAVVEMRPQSFLPKEQVAILAQVGAAQPYYGAIAVSPDEGLMVEATVAAANHHSTEAAERAALAGCDAKRKGAAPCVIVAVIRPKGWTERPFQLSSGATVGFREDFLKVRRDRAFAVSPATGLWGVGKGRNAADKAVADCAGKGKGVTDCTVVAGD
jgi:hypothetical protein